MLKLNVPTNTIPLDIGPIHFAGIGGIGMSGIAEILHNLGYQVQGSDAAASSTTTRLESLGIKIYISQASSNVTNAAVVVRSSAVPDNNEEIVEARKKHIPVILRAEMLAELMRLKTSIAVAGTHGKTTTTSLVTCLFASAGLDPTVINGGILNAYGTNAKLGTGQWLVAEADESDGTFLNLPATIGIITNIDPEHMVHYGSFEVLKQAFRDFIKQLPFYGFGVLCKDHPVVHTLIDTITDRKIVTYGIDQENVHIRGINIRTVAEGSLFDVVVNDGNHPKSYIIHDILLSTPGKHNVLNSLAAIAIAVELGFNEAIIKTAFCEFKGVKRRFTHTGTTNGVRIIDDYGHHPAEIAVTLRTAKDLQTGSNGRIIAVIQPHRYTRVKDLFEEFAQAFSDADYVFIAPVYAAGETPILGIDHLHLAEATRRSHPNDVYTFESEDELAQLVKQYAKSGDLVVCLGAGNITKWANELPAKLQEMA